MANQLKMKTENDRIPRTFKFTVRTLYYLKMLGIAHTRNHTSLIEFLVNENAKIHGITLTETKLIEFSKELEEKKNNKK